MFVDWWNIVINQPRLKITWCCLGPEASISKGIFPFVATSTLDVISLYYYEHGISLHKKSLCCTSPDAEELSKSQQQDSLSSCTFPKIPTYSDQDGAEGSSATDEHLAFSVPRLLIDGDALWHPYIYPMNISSAVMTLLRIAMGGVNPSYSIISRLLPRAMRRSDASTVLPA